MSPTATFDRTPEAFRRLMGRFTTGVGVVLGRDERGVVGLTVNSIASVSLEPMLLLFCTRLGSASAPRLLGAGQYTVNLLHERQREASRFFAGAREGVAAVDLQQEGALAWLPGANAVFVCEPHSVVPAGDHHIVVSHVLRLMGPEAAQPPLVYHEGCYAQIVPS